MYGLACAKALLREKLAVIAALDFTQQAREAIS
jgi:hypothetical protein